jgi:hypothetical protein
MVEVEVTVRSLVESLEPIHANYSMRELICQDLDRSVDLDRSPIGSAAEGSGIRLINSC